MVKRFYNLETFDTEIIQIERSTFPPSQICVCVHAPSDVHGGGGGLSVLPCHLVAPTGFAKATVWVTLRQFAPHRLIFLL